MMTLKIALLSTTFVGLALTGVIGQASQVEGRTSDYPNGRILTYTYPRADGHPFINESWMSSTLWANGKVFENQLIKLDICNNFLLINHFNESGAFIIALNPESVDSFRLGNKLMVPVTIDSTQGIWFVELLDNGQPALYNRPFKSMRPQTGTNPYAYHEANEVYLKNGHSFIEIKNRKDLLEALADKKPEIQKYIKTYKLEVNRKNPGIIKQIVDHYKQL